MSLAPVPSLDELAAHPERVQELPPEAARDFLVKIAGLQPLLLAQALSPTNGTGQAEAPAEDRLLTVEEAAAKLAVSKDWLYRRAGKLPFTIRHGPGQVRFSSQGIERYIRQRQGR